MAAVASAVQEPRELARAVLRRLAAGQDATGNLRDPMTGQTLPPSHYAVALFAGGCAMTTEEALRAPAERAVGYVLGIPAASRGAHELNNLGLLAVYRCWRAEGRYEGLCRRLEAYLARMPFTSLRGSVTNNWHAMRAVCLVQRGLALGRREDIEAGRRCLHEVVLPLQDQDGLFADYPPPGARGGPCTPLTYHAKVCAMLGLLLGDLRDERASAALRRGVLALANFCAPDGETLYFGRSCNSLYGYAASVYALSVALREGVVSGEDALRVSAAAWRARHFLEHLIRPDGTWRTYPTPFERERLGWDDYADRLDYAAFAAFLLAQTPSVPRVRPWSRPVRWEAREAGLWVAGGPEAFAAFSTRGQFDPGSYLFTDARYSGLQVLTWKHRGHTLVPPPPHEAADPSEPRWVGFMPVVQEEQSACTVRRYDEVRVFAHGAGVALVGRGVPVRLAKTASHRVARRAEAGGWLGWVIRGARIAARSLGVRSLQAYRETPLAGAEVRRALVWFREEGCLICVDRITGAAGAVWATIRLAAPPAPRDGRLRFCRPGLEGEIRFLHGMEAAPAVDVAFTSNGIAYVVRYPLSESVPAVAAVVLGDVETACRVSRDALTVRVDRRAVVVDLSTLEVRWCGSAW